MLNTVLFFVAMIGGPMICFYCSYSFIGAMYKTIAQKEHYLRLAILGALVIGIILVGKVLFVIGINPIVTDPSIKWQALWYVLQWLGATSALADPIAIIVLSRKAEKARWERK